MHELAELHEFFMTLFVQLVIFVIIRVKPVTLIVKACPELDEGCFWFKMSHAVFLCDFATLRDILCVPIILLTITDKVQKGIYSINRGKDAPRK